MTDRAVIHLVPHTHWDREWYEPFQVFRMRLVDLIERSTVSAARTATVVRSKRDEKG